MHRRAVIALVSATASLILLAGCGGRQNQQLVQETQDIANQLDRIEKKIDGAVLQPDDRVIIHVKNGRIDSVQPMTKWVCNPPGADCGVEVRWILAGAIDAGWKVHVEEKRSPAPTNCFKAFDLDRGARLNQQGPTQPCQVTGMIWEYDVILLDQNGAEKNRIDPLVPVSWGIGP